MKVLDTDIFIDFFQGNSSAVDFFTHYQQEIVFSAITEAELLSGKECLQAERKEKIFHFLAQFDKIPVDNPLVQIAADFRRNYKIELADALIAASAYMVAAPLITRNLDDFKKIKKIT